MIFVPVFILVGLIGFAFLYFLYTGEPLGAATVMMASVLFLEILHNTCATTRRKAIYRLTQFVCILPAFYISINIVSEDKNAILIIATFVFTILGLIIAMKIAFSWRSIIHDLRSGSDD